MGQPRPHDGTAALDCCFLQDGRVCDHRCGLTIQDVDKVLSGERLGEIIAAVQSHTQQQQLEELLSEDAEMAAAG